MLIRVVVAALLLSLSACAYRSTYFTPGERVSGVDLEGNPAALYPLRGPQGVFGEARLSSRGATMAERDGVEHTYVHVAVELHNTSAEALTMRRSDIRLAEVRLSSGTLKDVPALPVADLKVPPQGSGQWQLFFELPADIRPLQVDSFVVRWQVGGKGQRYKMRTLFIERRRYDYDPYYYGYVIYDVHHPHYWYYRQLGYCADPFCDTVIVYPRYRYLPPRRPHRTRSRPR